jgi:hypothetical protein
MNAVWVKLSRMSGFVTAQRRRPEAAHEPFLDISACECSANYLKEL